MRGVDLHCLPLTQDPAPFAGFLSTEERARAAGFHFARDCSRYIVARGSLRQLLSEVLEIPPARIEFTYNPQGKPETEGAHFNVSHSGDYALIAISKTRIVGVDIERMNRAMANDRIPERFFSPSEVRALRSLPEPHQLRGFFTCWTRKEAYVKARGLGLSLALDSFDVSLDDPARFLRGVEGWEIESISVPPGYAGALVASAALVDH